MHLVCEGACNKGWTAAFDAAVDGSKRVSVERTTGYPLFTSTVGDDWLETARRFVSTEHATTTDRDKVACAVCGTVRRYGRSV